MFSTGGTGTQFHALTRRPDLSLPPSVEAVLGDLTIPETLDRCLQDIDTVFLVWAFWGPQIRAGDVVRWPYVNAPTAPTDERDIAAVAVRALCEGVSCSRSWVRRLW
jgi:hypothetical protein